MICRDIQNRQCLRMLRVLFDSGSDSTLIHANCLPPGANPSLLKEPIVANTTAGTMKSKRQVWMANIILPEFDKHRHIDHCHAIVFDAPCNYDVILGRDVLAKIGMDVLFSTGTVRWMGIEIPMHEKGFRNKPATTFLQLYNDFHHEEEDDPWEEWWKEQPGEDDDVEDLFMSDMGKEGHGYKSHTIKEAKYEAVDPREAAAKQTHLTPKQQADLLQIFQQAETLFDGQLKKYPHRQFHLTLEKEAKPFCTRPYAVPLAHHEVFKKELEHLCAIGVLERCGASERAAGTFIIPKKDGRVRWISDFRRLNKYLRRRVYPLPIISEVLQ
jgi:Retroviral aspartyl protease